MIEKNDLKERLGKTEGSVELQRLRESEEKYRSLFESMVLGVVYQDNNGQITSVNPAAEEILGLTIDQMQGRRSTDPRWRSIHEDGSDFPGEKHPAMVALKTGEIVKDVIMGVFDPKNEQTRWININATPQFRKDDKKPFQVYTTFEDITKRKKAEETLNESEEKFSKAFHSNSAAMTVTRLSDGLIINANESFETLFGYTYDETVGHSTNELGIWLTPQERDAEVEELLKRGKLPMHEVTFGTKSGKHIHVLFSVELINIKGQIYILTTSMDITERKKAEQNNQKLLESEQQLTEELQTSNEELMHQGDELLKINKAVKISEERFRDIADNIPILAWTADANGLIYWYNKQWYEYTGTTLEEMHGWGWQQVHHPDYVDSVTEEWSKKIKEGNPYDNIFPLKGKDGKYRWFLTRVTPIKDEQNKIKRWFGTNTDITERKITENYNQQLLEQEQLLTEELQTSNEELQSTTEELRVSNEELQSTTEELQVTNEELRNQGDKLLKINKSLAESEERFRSIIENIQDGYMRIDKAGNMIMVSPSAARMYRFNSIQEMIGTDNSFLFQKL